MILHWPQSLVFNAALVLHANWFRHPSYGLVGAMDDQDAARIKALVPHAQYKHIPANHVIHVFEPERYVREVEAFAKGDACGANS